MEHFNVRVQDIENAERRKVMAAVQNAEFALCESLALRALGPGWSPWMKLSLLESDYHRRAGPPAVRATAYKVYRGDARLSAESIYLMERDGAVITAETPEELFGDLLTERHPTYGFEQDGRWIAFDRWCITWSALELYHPRSAEQLAEARVNRERKRAERELQKWRTDHPLLADLPNAEQ